MSGELARSNASIVAQALALNAWTLSQIEDAYFEVGQARPVLEERAAHLDSGQMDAEIAASAPALLPQVLGEGQ